MTFEEWFEEILNDVSEYTPEINAERKVAAMLAWNAGIDQWMKACKISAAQGHNDPCEFCGERCDGFAANPSKWPLIFTHPDGTGKPKSHHTGCVQKRLFKNDIQ